MLNRAIVVSLATTLLASAAHAANWPDRPQLRAVRATVSPVIDGDLSDGAWSAAPEFTDFTQHDPNDGEPATLPTSVRIVYDDDAIYFGLKLTDTHAPTAILVRRDSFAPSDFVSINIDPQHDRLSGNAFTITPAGVQIDTVLFNDIGEDGSWDGVWESGVKIVPDGWIAEVRVPYSQLRFPERESHTWGLNITRRTTRTNELVRIVNTRKGGTGFVSHFADIVGLEGIRRGRPLELVPYVVARSDVRSQYADANPLRDDFDHRVEGGLDVKYALTSSLTLTGTINPDFGQVEVDPAVVNLTDFETFYPERRPFFTEGLGIFRFADSPAPSHFNFTRVPNLFYTRRIGRAPQLAPDAEYVVQPSETTILGAAKLTGKLPGGWSLGILNALTDAERARFTSSPDVPSSRTQVEPMTNYFVSRATKEIGTTSRVGVMLTSVNRRTTEEMSPLLRDSAVTGGIDAYTSFGNRTWVLEGFAMGSHISGDEDAIALAQRSSSRYYQRPDAGHVRFDPTRSSLTGWAGKAMFSKATGRWRPNVQVQAYSPGFETNDTGFMNRTDMISSHALVQYVNQDPTKRFREKNVWSGVWQNRNFDGNTVEQGAFGQVFGTFANYWNYDAVLYLLAGAFSDTATRGGPLVRTPSGWNSDLELGSDERKPYSFQLTSHLEGYEDDSYVRTVGVGFNARPAANLTVSLEPSFTRSHANAQYVTATADPTATATYGRRYIFAELEQRAFELGTRVDWTLSSALSFQLYLQPFIATGDYHDYKTLDAARTRDYTPIARSAADPDFNFRSIRGSGVVRWEFRPGSALYVVWSENRSDTVRLGDFRLRRDFTAIPDAPSHDVFLVKLSYWFPM